MDDNFPLEARLLAEVGVDPAGATTHDLWQACAGVLRAELSRRWVRAQARERATQARRVHYLSMEFLLGRALGNAIAALDVEADIQRSLAAQARALEDLRAAEPDPGLGNGGLGRLAACFLDSLATLGIPAIGYGIRYEYGMFKQQIEAGVQVEYPDPWLANGTPWEFPRPALDCRVGFAGRVEWRDGRAEWLPDSVVLAKAYDHVVPGHGSDDVATLRLWRAAAPEHLDLAATAVGDFARAAAAKNKYEEISWVLYPNDSTPSGRELRLRQEYFFVAASLHDIFARHLGEHGTLANLAEHVVIHLNDTHPAIAVAEAMRLLCDQHGYSWDDAWSLTARLFSYTNHTLMQEALETWSLELLQQVLPRHAEIVLRIDEDLHALVSARKPGDAEFWARVSLIDRREAPRVRMAHLAVIGSRKVNGVSALHSELMVQTVFADLAELFPARFLNVTNGITPRRWLAGANAPLAALVDERLGREWRADLGRLAVLSDFAQDESLLRGVIAAKNANKIALARHLQQTQGVTVDPGSLFDVQVKRIHEYKRQLLNVLHVVTRYQAMLSDPDADWVPRTVIFAGKAASSYVMAKAIIRLINDVATTINADVRLRERLKVVFVPNYGVSVAELVIPAADLSQQISTAGTEASGTGNMKLALNGALTIGTLDGANIEMREHMGHEHMFVFGLGADEVVATRAAGYRPESICEADPMLRAALDAIAGGMFSPLEPARHEPIVASLLAGGDRYLLLADYASYMRAQQRVDARYRDRTGWASSALRNIAAMAAFSSDRAIREYASRVWQVTPRR